MYFGRWLCGHRIDLTLLYQLQISLLVADSFHASKQRDAVAVRAAKVAAVLIGFSIKAQMVFPWTVVIAEGAACLDLGTPERPRIDGKPTPPGCIHDGNFVINFVSQAESPLFIYAARCAGLSA